MARTRLYRNGTLESEDFPVEDISEHLKDDQAVIWLDLCRPSQEDFDAIRDEFGLHVLAVEDAMDFGQRSKIDRYRTHLFMSAHTVRLDIPTGQLTTSEVGAFITPQALITVRRTDEVDIEAVVARW